MPKSLYTTMDLLALGYYVLGSLFARRVGIGMVFVWLCVGTYSAPIDPFHALTLRKGEIEGAKKVIQRLGMKRIVQVSTLDYYIFTIVGDTNSLSNVYTAREIRIRPNSWDIGAFELVSDKMTTNILLELAGTNRLIKLMDDISIPTATNAVYLLSEKKLNLRDRKVPRMDPSSLIGIHGTREDTNLVSFLFSGSAGAFSAGFRIAAESLELVGFQPLKYSP